MSRSVKGHKGAGYEYWSKRAGPTMLSPGKSSKRLTHRAERRQRKAITVAPKERGH
jgi:hypothetical protein